MDMILKYLFGMTYFFILAFLVFVLWRQERISYVVKEHKTLIVVFIIFNIVVLNVFVYLHLSQESFIPSWDFGGFYRRALEFTDKLDRSLPEAFANLYNSINLSEYNYIAEWYLYLPMKIIGDSYLRFILCMLNVFVIPSNVLIFILYLLISTNKKNNWLNIAVSISIVLFSANLYPLIHGYIGSSGLFFIVFILIFVYLKKFESVNIPFSILTGLLLLLLLVTRRWYAYWIVGFFISLVLPYIIFKKNWNKLKPVIINCIIMGLVALGLLLLLFFPLFKTITTYNYSEAYSVMKATGISEIIISFIKVYGILNVFLMVVGIYSIIKYEYFKKFGVFLISQILLSIILFNQVQRFGSHHYYIINEMCLLLVIIGLYNLFSLAVPVFKKIVICVFLLFMTTNFMQTTLLSNKKMEQFHLTTNWFYGRTFPVIRITENKDGIIGVINRINSLAGEYDYTYAIASSVVFNEDFLRNALLPNDLEGLHNLIPTSVYDMRDYLPEK